MTEEEHRHHQLVHEVSDFALKIIHALLATRDSKLGKVIYEVTVFNHRYEITAQSGDAQILEIQAD